MDRVSRRGSAAELDVMPHDKNFLHTAIYRPPTNFNNLSVSQGACLACFVPFTLEGLDSKDMPATAHPCASGQ